VTVEGTSSDPEEPKINLDASFLADVGLRRLVPAEANLLLVHLYETLEMRVGIRLADQMSDRDVDEFEVFFDRGDDEGAFRWLSMNLPDYKAVVREEAEQLKVELRQLAPTILALTGAF
jgi:hypothetical protein